MHDSLFSGIRLCAATQCQGLCVHQSLCCKQRTRIVTVWQGAWLNGPSAALACIQQCMTGVYAEDAFGVRMGLLHARCSTYLARLLLLDSVRILMLIPTDTHIGNILVRSILDAQ